MEVSIDWTKAPVGERVLGSINIMAENGEKERVWVSVFNPASPLKSELDTLYVETNGYVSIEATGYHRKVENDFIKMCIIPNLGVENTAIQLGNPIAPANVQQGGIPHVWNMISILLNKVLLMCILMYYLRL